MQSINSALCFFDSPPHQTDIISSTIVDIVPTTNIDGNQQPIQFDIPANPQDYIDCQSIDLELCIQIKKTDGTNIDSSKDKVGLANLPIASLFSDVYLILNDKQIEGGDRAYPYGAYIHTMTQFQKQAKQSHLQVSGWYDDQQGKFDDVSNTGLKRRMDLTADSKELYLKGPVYLDFLRQSRYLLSQVKMQIKFIRANPEFALMAFGATNYQVNISNAVLNVRRVTMNPSVINEHATGLRKNNAIYPVNHSVLTNFTIGAGSSSHAYPNLFPTAMPKAVYITFVENEAFIGAFEKNPFNFQHFNVSKLALYQDGKFVSCKAYEPNFKDGKFAREYGSIFTALNMFNTDDSNGITMDMYKNGYFFIMYNLTADADLGGESVGVTKPGNLRLEVSFESPLKKTITCLIYAIYDSKVEITRMRDVTVSYQR